MKSSVALLALISGLTTFPSLTAGESKPTPFRVEVCPYGHTTLTNIPIKYGCILPNAEIKKAQDNYEYVPAGCGFHPGESPTNAILCSTCKFVYQLYDLSNPDEGYWNRRSKDRQSFRKIFPELIQEFPLPDEKLLLDNPEFSQAFSITKDGHNMIYGYVVDFTTNVSLEAMKDQIKQYLEKHNLTAKYSEEIHSTPTNKYRDFYTWESKDPHFTIRLADNPGGTNKVHVSLMQKEDAEKSGRGE